MICDCSLRACFNSSDNAAIHGFSSKATVIRNNRTRDLEAPDDHRLLISALATAMLTSACLATYALTSSAAAAASLSLMSTGMHRAIPLESK